MVEIRLYRAFAEAFAGTHPGGDLYQGLLICGHPGRGAPPRTPRPRERLLLAELHHWSALKVVKRDGRYVSRYVL